MIRTISSIFLILLFPLLLSSCGFALRGSDVVSTNFTELALNLEQPNSEFSRLLRRSLDVANVETTIGMSATVPTLNLSSEQVVSRPITVNPRARAAQYEIRLSLQMSLVMNGEFVIPQQSLIVQRNYFEDIANIAGNREEVDIITAEMRRDLVNQLMRRLEAVGS